MWFRKQNQYWGNVLNYTAYSLHSAHTIILSVKLFMIETDPIHHTITQEVLLKLFIIDEFIGHYWNTGAIRLHLKGVLMKSTFIQYGWKMAIKHLLLWWVELWMWWKESSVLRVITFSLINHAFRWREDRNCGRTQKGNGYYNHL